MFNWAGSSKKFQGNRARKPYFNELVKVHDFKRGDSNVTARLVGPVLMTATHWFKVRKKDGGIAGPFPKKCLALNPKTGEMDLPCPYCDISSEKGEPGLRANAIIRSAQRLRPAEQPPRTKAEKTLVPLPWAPKVKGYIKDKTSDSWTPTEVLDLNGNTARQIIGLAEVNKRKMKDGTKKAFGPEHPTYGFDMIIAHTPKAKPAYNVQKEDRTALKEAELKYMLWDLNADGNETLKEALKEAASLKKRLVLEGDNEEDTSDTDGEDADADGGADAEDEGKAEAKKPVKKQVKKAGGKPVKAKPATAKTSAVKKSPKKSADGKKGSAVKKKLKI